MENVIFSTLAEEDKNHTWKLIASILSLLTSMLKTNEVIRKAVWNLQGVPSFQLALVKTTQPQLPEHLRVAAMSCLYAFSEDNKALANKICAKREWINLLSSVGDASMCIRAYACGILHNISREYDGARGDELAAVLSDSRILFDLEDVITRSSSLHVRQNGNSVDASVSAYTMKALQASLEVIASIDVTAQEDFEDVVQEFQQGDATGGAKKVGNRNSLLVQEEELDGDEDVEILTVTDGLSISPNGTTLASESTWNLLEHILTDTTELIWPFALPPSPNPGNISSTYHSALSALNNIAWTASWVLDSGYPSPSISSTWPATAQLLWTKIIVPVLEANTADVPLASKITSLAWALARSVNGRILLSCGEHLKFMALYQASCSLPSSTSTSTNSTQPVPYDLPTDLGVKCLGVLGSLARAPDRVPINARIGRFLLSLVVSLPSTPTACAVEALDQILEIYADEASDYDGPVFRAEDFLAVLESADLRRELRAMAKKVDRRREPQMRERADQVLLELGRFCAYKRRKGR